MVAVIAPGASLSTPGRRSAWARRSSKVAEPATTLFVNSSSRPESTGTPALRKMAPTRSRIWLRSPVPRTRWSSSAPWPAMRGGRILLRMASTTCSCSFWAFQPSASE